MDFFRKLVGVSAQLRKNNLRMPNYSRSYGKLSKLKSGETWETVQSGDNPLKMFYVLCLWVLIRCKWVIILLVFGTLWNLGLFCFRRPPLILNFSQLKVGTFLIFWRPPPLFRPFPKFPRFLVWKASLTCMSLKNTFSNYGSPCTNKAISKGWR